MRHQENALLGAIAPLQGISLVTVLRDKLLQGITFVTMPFMNNKFVAFGSHNRLIMIRITLPEDMVYMYTQH